MRPWPKTEQISVSPPLLKFLQIATGLFLRYIAGYVLQMSKRTFQISYKPGLAVVFECVIITFGFGCVVSVAENWVHPEFACTVYSLDHTSNSRRVMMIKQH